MGGGVRRSMPLIMLAGLVCVAGMTVVVSSPKIRGQVLGEVSRASGGAQEASVAQSEDQVRALYAIVKAQELLEGNLPALDLRVVAKYHDTPEYYRLQAEGARAASEQGEKTDMPAQGEFTAEKVERTKWSYNAGKVRNETLMVKSLSGREQVMTHYLAVFDGTNSYVYTSDLKHGEIKPGKDFMCDQARGVNVILGRPFADKPLSELLRTAGTRYEGRETVNGMNCHKVIIPACPPSKVTYTLWFSPEHGYRLVRAINAVTDSPRAGHGLLEIEKLEQVSDTWMPTKATSSSFAATGGSQVPLTKMEWRVEAYTTDAADCDFRLQFPIGTKVFDQTTGKFWVEGESTASATAAGIPGR